MAEEVAGSRAGGVDGDPAGRTTGRAGDKPTGEAAGVVMGVFAADVAGRGDKTCIETPSGFVNVIAGGWAGLSSIIFLTEFAGETRGCTLMEGAPI